MMRDKQRKGDLRHKRTSCFFLLYPFTVYPSLVMTALTLGGYFLPHDSGDKVSFNLTILLAMTVFMMSVSESAFLVSRYGRRF